MPPQYGLQRPRENRVVTVGNTNPSGRGMNGLCYSAEGVNPTLTTNKGEGNKVAVPVLAPDRTNKKQNGRRFKEDGEESFTLTSQDRHGVAVEVTPVQLSGDRLSESEDIAHSLNCSDQRKVFGAHQTRTMVGYNATAKMGGHDTDSQHHHGERLQGSRKSNDDSCGDVFCIDKGVKPKEREIANCIEAREDRGLSKRGQEGTLICHKVWK